MPRARALGAAALAAALAVLLAGCLPPESPVPAAFTQPDVVVRVHERGATAATVGTLLRLTADSVSWRPAAVAVAVAGAGAEVRSVPLQAVERVEVRAPRSQRAALRRGLVRGAVVGAGLGGALLAVRPGEAGGAIALTLGSAWVTGVIAGQQAQVSRTPNTWRTVHPRPAG